METLYTIRHRVHPIIYIGISSDVNARFREHKRESSNKLLRHYLSLLGVDTFEFKIVYQDTSRTNIEELEALAIQEAFSLNRLIVCNKLIGSVATGEATNKGEEHWNSKFTEDDIRTIRLMYAAGGVTQKALGEMYGCTNKVISKITTGARWKSVEGAPSKNLTVNKVANRRKLTDEQVVELRWKVYELANSGSRVNLTELAESTGVSRNSVGLILKGTSYPDLPGPIAEIDYQVPWRTRNVK